MNNINNYFEPPLLESGDIRTQPASRQAEEALLGSFMIDPMKIKGINISSDDFYIIRNRWIYEAMGEVMRSDGTFDILTIKEYLENMGQLEEIGGSTYLMFLVNQTPSSLNAENYAKIIRDKRQRRGLLAIGNELAKIAYMEDVDLSDRISRIMTDLTRNSEILDGAQNVVEALNHLYDNIIERMNDPKDIWGIPTGFTEIDYATGGAQLGELWVFSGDPGVGKTNLLTQISMNMIKNSRGVLYQMEMKDTDIMRRIVSIKSKVQARKMKTGKLDKNNNEFDRIVQAIEEIGETGLLFSDNTRWTTNTLRADLARLKSQLNIQWFALDYLYKLNDFPDEKESERLGKIAKSLKSICLDLKIAGLSIHSLTKEKGYGGRGMGDLRGSNQIGYEADTVFYLSVDEKNSSQVNVDIWKFREDSGGFGGKTIKLKKNKEFPNFENWKKEEKKEDLMQKLPYPDD